MRTVILPLKSSELSTQMAAMRMWLDERRVEPSGFSCRDGGMEVIVRVNFEATGDADAFARRFSGQIDQALTEAGRAPDGGGSLLG